MAVISATSLQGTGWKVGANTTLGASDTLVYDPSKTQVLILHNVTAGALTPKIDGTLASAAIPVQGYGTVSAAAGLTSASVAAGSSCSIILKNNYQYMAGTVEITGGDGMEAILLEF